MRNDTFRICPESGLQFHKPSEWLMRTHAVFAVVILLFGGITALLVTLTRWCRSLAAARSFLPDADSTWREYADLLDHYI